MLDVKNIYKTFNPGTVNQKTALNGLSLHLAPSLLSSPRGGHDHFLWVTVTASFPVSLAFIPSLAQFIRQWGQSDLLET